MRPPLSRRAYINRNGNVVLFCTTSKSEISNSWTDHLLHCDKGTFGTFVISASHKDFENRHVVELANQFIDLL